MNITKQLNKYIEKSSEDIFIMLVFGIKSMLSSTIFRNESQIHTVCNVLPVASRISFNYAEMDDSCRINEFHW